MKPIGLLVVLVGCGAKPAEPLSGIGPAATPVTTHIIPAVAIDRPLLDIASLLPDPTEHGRWPLDGAQHPALEPTFDIAGALAQSSITWQQLCDRGADHRHLSGNNDLSDYLGAWCSVERHDTKDALFRLGLLHSSTILGLSAAVKRDCADILVDQGPSDEVERLLRTNGLLDAPTVDLVSAAYFEIGKRDDAYAINDLAIQMDRTANNRTQCLRFARGAVVATDWNVDAMIEQLHQKGEHDALCGDLDHELECWRTPGSKCGPYFRDQKRPTGELELVQLYLNWPRDARSSDHWLDIGDHALKATPIAEAAKLYTPAFEVGMRISDCQLFRIARVYDTTSQAIAAVRRLSPTDRLDPLVDQRLETLWEQINALRAAWNEGGEPACRTALAKLPHLR
jgi:hypothetical protein